MNSSDFLTSEGNNNQQQQQTLSNTLTNDTMVASPSEEWSIQTIYGSQLETASEPSQPPIDQKPQMKIEDQDGKSNTLTNNTIIYGGQPEITSEPSQPPIDQDSKIEDQETDSLYSRASLRCESWYNQSQTCPSQFLDPLFSNLGR